MFNTCHTGLTFLSKWNRRGVGPWGRAFLYLTLQRTPPCMLVEREVTECMISHQSFELWFDCRTIGNQHFRFFTRQQTHAQYWYGRWGSFLQDIKSITVQIIRQNGYQQKGSLFTSAAIFFKAVYFSFKPIYTSFLSNQSAPVTHQTTKFGEICKKIIALPSGEITVDYKVGHLVFEST